MRAQSASLIGCFFKGFRVVRLPDFRPIRLKLTIPSSLMASTRLGRLPVFGQGHFTAYTISEIDEPITTTMNIKVTPDYSS